MNINSLGAGVFTITDFLSDDECKRYIALSEAMGYEEASMGPAGREVIYKEHRNNNRIVFDRADIAQELFDKARACLNDGFEGGDTQFQWESVKPQRGMALVFPHRLSHQGSAVSSGVKYVLRTDVMYSAPAPVQSAGG